MSTTTGPSGTGRGLNSHAHSFPDCLFRGSPKRQWSGWSLQSRRKMRCPGRATLRKAAERGAMSSYEKAEGGVLLLLPPWWTSCKSQSKLFLVACDASRPPKDHAPHLYTLRTCHIPDPTGSTRLVKGTTAQVEDLRRDLREGKGYQGPTDHYEVENVPEVTEVGTLVQDEP